jgi:3-deoxy-7-phosphoheptulonate synthase
MLRGGAFKPRTSPYSFQGLGQEGLELLAEAREATGLPIVTEVTSPQKVALVSIYADVLQIGARNMQNFDLLNSVGRAQRPVLLKRGMSATVEDFLMAAEYLLSHGNYRVMLCERGIRTFDNKYTRNSFDVNAIPLLKQLTHLPVIADPSHATGVRRYVTPVARAAVGAGADGVIVEVHPDPDSAVSDGDQSLLPEQFFQLVKEVRAVAAAVGRSA